MARKRTSGLPGLTFSWKRALGASAAKAKFARATGIPTTRGGRERKIGRLISGGGCCLMLSALSLVVCGICFVVLRVSGA